MFMCSGRLRVGRPGFILAMGRAQPYKGLLDLPPFLAHLMKWARDNRRSSCACPLTEDGRAACKGEDDTEPNYLFLGPDGGHPRRSNYAHRRLTPAAEGLYPARRGIRRPVYVTASSWPGIPIRKGNRITRASDIASGTWADLAGAFNPHDYRHTHATWLDTAELSKVIQMDRRGHALPGMDAVYNHITPAMRQRLCDVLEAFWDEAVTERYKIAPTSAVPLLHQALAGHAERSS
jgi:integrase